MRFYIIKNYLKIKALFTKELSRDIIDQCYNTIPTKTRLFLLKYISMRNRILILRKRNDIKYVSKNNSEIIKNTSKVEFFYLFDLGENDKNSVCFSTTSNILHLENSKIYM
ncbi:hypothetical protein DMUE_4229 [Dictyocoela muelleri]|nr:hypothetical protein DMUE_4229 [Dictyocoela muelleri]